MENDLNGNENYFELTGGSSYRGFKLLGVDCIQWGTFMIGPAELIRFFKEQPLGCYCGEHFKMLGIKILMTMHPTTNLFSCMLREHF